MNLQHRVFRSQPAKVGFKGPRFANQEWIQGSLERICEAWFEFIRDYLLQAEALFGGQLKEPPWREHEGTVVSTLVGAIIRKFPKSIALEECEVEKPGVGRNEHSRKETDRGFCDLWASIPELKNDDREFNFFLEAKKSGKEWAVTELSTYLAGRYGVSKIFRDYEKGSPGKIDQRRRFKQPLGRNHEHLAIGLSVIPLQRVKPDLEEIVGILDGVFNKTLRLHLQSKMDPKKARKMERYPTVALIVVDEDARNKRGYPGMIAIFTVLGSTRRLAFKRDQPEEVV